MMCGYLAERNKVLSKIHGPPPIKAHSLVTKAVHSASTKELAKPPKKGTSNRSRPSAASMLVTVYLLVGEVCSTVSISVKSQECYECYVAYEQDPGYDCCPGEYEMENLKCY